MLGCSEESASVLDVCGEASLHGCRQDMTDCRPNHKPYQVSGECLGHLQFKVQSAKIFEAGGTLDD